MRGYAAAIMVLTLGCGIPDEEYQRSCKVLLDQTGACNSEERNVNPPQFWVGSPAIGDEIAFHRCDCSETRRLRVVNYDPIPSQPGECYAVVEGTVIREDCYVSTPYSGGYTPCTYGLFRGRVACYDAGRY